MNLFRDLLENPFASLFLIIGLGCLVGSVRIRGVRLGLSGVLVSALAAGHLGADIPEPVGTLGVILFVYSVGLLAGPRFFRAFKAHAARLTLLGLVISAAGLAAACASGRLLGLPVPITVGIFAGALTSTPALAAALESLQSPLVTVGYGLSYPVGLIGVVLFVQLAPRGLRLDAASAEKRYREASRGADDEIVSLSIRITNPACTRAPIGRLPIRHISEANLARYRRGEEIGLVHGDTQLALGDVVLAVGSKPEVEKLALLLGEASDEPVPPTPGAESRFIIISESRAAGRSLRALRLTERFGAVVTRIQRSGLTFPATGGEHLEIGDRIRVNGTPGDLDRLAAFAGHREEVLEETDIFSLVIGLAAGIFLGMISFPLGAGVTVRLGMAGGPLIVAILISHFGHIGRVRAQVPPAARKLIGDLGLVFFLADAGVDAGREIVPVLRELGPAALAAAGAAVVIPLAVAFVFSRYVLKMNELVMLGGICGGMTSTPALGALRQSLDSDVPTIAYASLYPFALVMMTVAAQLLIGLLRL